MSEERPAARERSRARREQRERWSGERAERHLRSLELFGMRFGLDRMRRMMTVLHSPERRFRSLHVVGTNGKSSTTRMTAAILERHGLRTGAYLSPHLISYTERVQVGERDLPMHEFAAAVARAAWAAERVNRTLAEDDHVTQFELLTAAAFWALAERGVDVAVIEAGLGGRYDATAVIESRVTALTNVGLEHTRWLGPTVHDIAAEKLAVLKHGTTLALGADLDPEARAVARAVATEREARTVTAAITAAIDGAPSPGGGRSASGGEVADVRDLAPSHAARGTFQRRNFALARAAAEAYLVTEGIALREDAVRDAAAATVVPGRLHVISDSPLTILDGAHNPDAVAALVESLPELLSAGPPDPPGLSGLQPPGAGPDAPRVRRPVRELALVLGVLEDKDAASMLRALLPLCARAWFTAPPSGRALSPAALLSLARQLGFEEALCEPQPRRALEQAQAWARDRPPAAVLATGSVYLVGDLLGAIAECDGGEAADDRAQDHGAGGARTARVRSTSAAHVRGGSRPREGGSA